MRRARMQAVRTQLASSHFQPVIERHCRRLAKESQSLRREPSLWVNAVTKRVLCFDAPAPQAIPPDRSAADTADQLLKCLRVWRVYEGWSTFRPDQGGRVVEVRW